LNNATLPFGLALANKGFAAIIKIPVRSWRDRHDALEQLLSKMLAAAIFKAIKRIAALPLSGRKARIGAFLVVDHFPSAFSPPAL
jgi:hypothetical protein